MFGLLDNCFISVETKMEHLLTFNLTAEDISNTNAVKQTSDEQRGATRNKPMCAMTKNKQYTFNAKVDFTHLLPFA